MIYIMLKHWRCPLLPEGGLTELILCSLTFKCHCAVTFGREKERHDF